MTLIRSSLLALLAVVTMTLAGCGGATEEIQTTGETETIEPDVNDGAILDLSHLSEEDQKIAQQQKFCPVGGKDALLGSGGMKAVKVNVEGRDVFLCCDGCEEALRADPAKYFAILDGAAPEGDSAEPGEPAASPEGDDADASVEGEPSAS